MSRRHPPATATHPVDVRLFPPGAAAFISRHGRRFRTADLVHPYHKLCLVEAGRGTLRHAGGVVPLERGGMLRVPAGLAHRFDDAPRAPLTLAGLCVHEDAFSTFRGLAEAWRGVETRLPAFTPLALFHPFAVADYQRMIRQIIRETAERRPLAELACLAAVAQFLVALGRDLQSEPIATSEAPDGFRASLAWLEERLTHRVAIPDLARIAGVSYRSYTTRFHRETGLTVTQYLNRRRVAIARQRLIETGDIVSSALESGFRDLSHFYRQFRAHAGCTPAEYIARAASPT